MKQKLKMIWRILCDKQVVVITEDHGRIYYGWDTRSLEDVCEMCHKVYDMVYYMNNNKSMNRLEYIPGDFGYMEWKYNNYRK